MGGCFVFHNLTIFFHCSIKIVSVSQNDSNELLKISCRKKHTQMFSLLISDFSPFEIRRNPDVCPLPDLSRQLNQSFKGVPGSYNQAAMEVGLERGRLDFSPNIFYSRVTLRNQFVFINGLLATQSYCRPTKIVLVLTQFKRRANINMKLINELFELMMLIMCNKISEELPSNVGKGTGQSRKTQLQVQVLPQSP